jgi:ABC-2 type transport system ATP-binding protein
MVQKAIIAEDLTFRYGDLTAVDHISFSVGQGEILGFLGPNGAGKSTTIKMLTGQLQPDSGTVTILGLESEKSRTEIQAQIGVCFEEKNLYPNMTAVENLSFFASLFGTKKASVLRRKTCIQI